MPGLPVLELAQTGARCCCCCQDAEDEQSAGMRRLSRLVRRRRGGGGLTEEEAFFVMSEAERLLPGKMRTCGDHFEWLKGGRPEGGPVWKALTAQPEQPNKIYAAQENGHRPAAVTFCYRSGCKRFEDIPGFSIQRVVNVPCGAPMRFNPKKKPEFPNGVILSVRCGQLRDCLPYDRFFLLEEQADATRQQLLQSRPGLLVTMRPRGAAEPIPDY